MKIDDLIAKLEEIKTTTGTNRILVRVAVPGDEVNLMSDQSAEPVHTVQTYKHLDIEDLSIWAYHDPGETNWVAYIKTKEV